MKTIKTKIKAIIFDMDGTIIDTENMWRNATKNLLKLHGINEITEKNKQAFVKTAAGGLHVYCQILKNEFNIPLTIEQLIKQKMEFVRKKVAETKINFITGFIDFHNKLKNYNIATSIATNANIEGLNILNKKLNLQDIFGQHLYSMEHAGNNAKPNPDVFLYAAKKLNVKPEECIVFEDSLVGFKAAKAAGIKCIAIKNESNKNFLSHVDGMIDDYSQAEQTIKTILFTLKENKSIKNINI